MLKTETKDMEEYTIQLQDHVFDYFNLIVKEYYMSLDKRGADNDYVKTIKEEYKKIDEEADEEEMKEEIPEGLTQPIAEQLLNEKEALLKNVYGQIVQMQNRGQVDGQNYDLEQTVVLNKTMFDDKMYLKTGFSGKDLQRAVRKFGIYDRKMKEARQLEQAKQDKLLEQFNSYLKQKKEEKDKAVKDQKESKNETIQV